MLNALIRLFRLVKPIPHPVAEKSERISYGPKVCVAFSNPKRSWSEEFDLREVLIHVLDENGHNAQRAHDGELMVGGYLLFPELSSFTPLDDGEGSRSCTIIRLNHPELGCAQSFEWQHSIGHTLEEACRTGFEKWCKSDLVALLDVTRQNTESCTCIEVQLPERAVTKRYVLGPVEITASSASDLELINSPDKEGHSFCPCCLTTACMKILAPVIEDQRFAGIRYFVMRDQDGVCSADCRINGLDFDPGKAALIEYAKKWPGNGFQYRKQYVVAHDFLPPDTSAA